MQKNDFHAFLQALSIAALWLLLAPSRSGAVIADDANDICSPSADPCVISSLVDVVDQSSLDFGLRSLVLTGGGRFSFGNGSAEILCGRLNASPNSIFIDASGPEDGETTGGDISIFIRRGCSNAPTIPCLDDTDCPSGTCSVGDGSATVDGEITGNGDEPASIDIFAAGDVVISKPIRLKGTSGEAPGGTLSVESATGSVHIADKINVLGGGLSEGGEISLTAALDIVVDDDIEASGGDGDGGIIDIAAGRDYVQSGTLTANAVAGEGFGGEIIITAGRDIIFTDGTTNQRRSIIADGHTSGENFGGDGGLIELDADRDVRLGVFSRIRADGSQPDGFGGEISVLSGRDTVLNGEVRARAAGKLGEGGFFEVLSDGGIEIGATGSVDLLGGERGGGIAEFLSKGPFSAFGTIDVTAGNGGPGGSVEVLSDDNAIFQSTFTVGGSLGNVGEGRILVQACLVEMREGASFENTAPGGQNLIIAREAAVLLVGSELRAPAGSNRILYRNPDVRPVVLGFVSPIASEIVDETIELCPECGNGVVEGDEICDDGNVTDGDGCNATCVDEGCIAMTPGYPEVALCDDRDLCTVDSCDPTIGECERGAVCDDGIECTVDSCANGVCTAIPTDSRCDDGNVCTDDFCSTEVDCAAANNAAPCDDGLFCTVDDSCLRGACGGDARDCNDSVGCTIDSCDELADTCTNAANDEACFDDVFCNGLETCSVESGCQVAPSEADCSGLDGVCEAGVCDAELDICVREAANESAGCDDGDECSDNDVCAAGVCQGVAIPDCVVPVCGNGTVEGDETCDDGDAVFAFGDACSGTCLRVPCGRPTNSMRARPVASDALYVLRVAVGDGACVPEVCDVNNSGLIRASDALAVLVAAVAGDVTLICPAP
ncbi:MAG: cysteine-rich repeat protein [Hyphomicrobiaceae bacterium]|jgi:cysteine-rich repeat protein